MSRTLYILAVHYDGEVGIVTSDTDGGRIQHLQGELDGYFDPEPAPQIQSYDDFYTAVNEHGIPLSIATEEVAL